MRRLLVCAAFVCTAFLATAQSDTTAPVKIYRPVQVRAKDHFLIQFGAATWQNKPDSVKTGGFSRTFNMYLMYDFPFKTAPKFSIALGPGLSTDHIFLNKSVANITNTGTKAIFRNLADSNHFKKFKVATAFLELPVELRFSSNPDADGKSFKLAVGLKAGTMLAAWTKGKTLQTAGGATVSDYIEKEKSKRFFNTTRISATARIGYGHFSLFGSYALTTVFKEAVGPQVNTLSLGLTLSGL